MSFEFLHGCEDAYKMFSGMIKNEGAWKSIKQRDFALKKILPVADRCFPRNQENVSIWVNGVTLNDGQSAIMIEGETRWANYGVRGYRRVGWLFIVDDIGVDRQYKLHYFAGKGVGGPNPNKYELLFRRAVGVQAPTPIIEEPKPELVYLSEVGDKITAHLQLVYHTTEPSPFGYHQTSHFTMWKDEVGNMVWYNNFPSNVSSEQCQDGIDVTFTVKKHHTSKKGERVTIASRMKLTKHQLFLNTLAS